MPDARAEDWVVRPVTGSAASRPYRCPGCDHEIRPATPHVVVWPRSFRDDEPDDEAGLSERRHWHTSCWQARDRRGPLHRDRPRGAR